MMYAAYSMQSRVQNNLFEIQPKRLESEVFEFDCEIVDVSDSLLDAKLE